MIVPAAPMIVKIRPHQKYLVGKILERKKAGVPHHEDEILSNKARQVMNQ
jgi:hypothetical protein